MSLGRQFRASLVKNCRDKKKFIFFFAFLLLTVETIFFKVLYSNNFLIWHYCLFVRGQKSSGSTGDNSVLP
jgi:hypothetical protein